MPNSCILVAHLIKTLSKLQTGKNYYGSGEAISSFYSYSINKHIFFMNANTNFDIFYLFIFKVQRVQDSGFQNYYFILFILVGWVCVSGITKISTRKLCFNRVKFKRKFVKICF